jgi:DNA-binding IclR family transcriptional regulator
MPNSRPDFGQRPKDTQDGPIASVARAFHILELLAAPDGPKPLAEISRQLELAPSTTHRFLKALTALGFVSQDPKTSIYRATLKLFNLGRVVVSQLNLSERLLPVMRQIAEQVGESVTLVLREGAEGVLIERVQGREGVQVFARYRSNPLYCTAAGKAVLACFDAESLQEYLRKTSFISRTQYTLTNPLDLEREVDRIRREGFAIDNQELEIGAMCVAVPLMLTNDLMAAVSVSALAPRMTEQRMRAIAAILSEALAEAGLGPPETRRRLAATSNIKRQSKLAGVAEAQ